MNDATGAMQQYGASAPPGTPGSQAGFVLLYAESLEGLPAAWPFAGPRLQIGRDASSDISIPVHAVSRQHAQLVWERGGWTLYDSGSTNGTLVDGRPIREARLEPEQEIRIGDAIVKFVNKQAELYAAFRPDGSLSPNAARKATHQTELLGGFQMDGIAAALERIAESELSVMLLGESGTGKEVASRELHRLSNRRGDFYAINCAAIPGNLLESELFGYKRGAFSGADRDKPGLIRMAHRGTLLLDEIGDMPLEAQAKLLRVLQNREVFPLGATTAEKVDVRILCATHRDLTKLQNDGSFRKDLFARLNEYQLRLPPLRERKEDIYQLLRAFLERQGRADLKPNFQFMTALLHYDWPYNVRELVACVKRCVALAETTQLAPEILPDAVQESMLGYGQPLAGTLDEETGADDDSPRAPPEEAVLRELLSRHQGNVAAVGRELGKARMQVHRWLKRYNIDLEEYR